MVANIGLSIGQMAAPVAVLAPALNDTGAPHAAPSSNTSSSGHGGAWGTDPLKAPFDLWLIQVLLILVIARVLAFLLKKIHQPSVIAEVIAGILLGPSAVRSSGAIFRGGNANLSPAVGWSYSGLLEHPFPCEQPGRDKCDWQRGPRT